MIRVAGDRRAGRGDHGLVWLGEVAIRPWNYRSWIFPANSGLPEGRPDP
ncbi:MAG: hypothetical protein ACLP8S_17235 [Solirubrobacteraceae bacterium]